MVASGYGAPQIIERRLQWSPQAAGIDLTNAGNISVPTDTGYLPSSNFTSKSNWIISLGTVNRNVTIDLGGKSAVIIGGAIYLNTDPTADYSTAITARRGLLVQNFKYLHIEGLTIGGTYASDGINLATNVAGAIAQIEMVRVEGITENYYDTGTSVALITNTGQAQYNHPDVIQTYGGPMELRVDHIYARSDRSFMTVATSGGPNMTKLDVRHVDYKQTTHPILGNQRTYPVYWDQASGETNSFPWNFSEFYYQHGTGARTAIEAMFPDGDSRWVADVTAGGVIEGKAPKQEFVPPNVHVNYSSPGYLS